MATNPLQLVDLIDSDDKLIPGLVPVHGVARENLRIDEQAAITYAKIFNRIDYIFFRRFSDGRSSQISAYVVDNADERLDEETLAKLHLEVWLHGAAPLIYISWPTRIDILTCARGPDFWVDEGVRYKTVKRFEVEAIGAAATINRELKNFSALRLADGTFWEETPNQGLANYAKTAHQLLIQAIVETDAELPDEAKPILRQLLLLMVLIKYLEDRRVFPDGFFGSYHEGANRFFEVLQGGKPQEVCRLLDFLEAKFNGDVFSLSSEARKALNNDNLILFANLVEARTLKKQRYLWQQFSFEHLPVEIISNLYQRFVDGGHGAIYTPPFLASLLLDYAMPYENLSGKERVLDPACGSGIFLVGAFKRLINVWRSQNNWQRPKVNTLKRILKDSIFGIELDEYAIHLASFSMCLTICDALQPEVIWDELKFDKLRESNLRETDFFNVILDFQQTKPTAFKERFDVIIGNPPFESQLSAPGVQIDRVAQREDKKRGVLPDKQSAYLFLEQAYKILRTGGQVCLIQPAGLLYNSKAKNFRTYLFQKYKVDTIFDFVSIRKLYEEADVKTIAIFAQASEPYSDHRITHLTFRRTVSVKEHICFELDHYDRHHVFQKHVEYPYIWRSNLLGGGRLFDISLRLQSMRKLGKFIAQKEWDYGEGFIVGKKGGEPAPFLQGKDYLPTQAFTNIGINETDISPLTKTRFVSPRSEKRFTPPLILIKEVATLPMEYWDKGVLTYGHRIVGIHAPQTQASELHNLFESLISKREIYQFCCELYGTESLVNKASAIRKQDIDALPYPEDLNDLSFSFWEEAIREDTLKYLTNYVRLGQNSDLLTKAADIDDLNAYSEIFIRMLKSVYDNLKASDPIFLNGLTCQPFYFGERPDSSWLSEEEAENELRKLVYADQDHIYLRTIRILRLYSENFLLLIKPDRLRYWIRSTAVRDADETIVDLRRQGY
ncbi:MAG: N-6 DNA methylase [Chloroflexota bacterium]|nr:N-6 DNA methylase [Chloroflexota bacterium]